jgi:tetratricopeptide (TPR) repeat protein
VHRVLSWKRLLIVVGVFVVLSATAFGLYRVQSKRHAAILKAQAEKSVASAGGDLSKTDEAAGLYARYLKFNPRDEEAFGKYAELMLARAESDPKKYAQQTADALAAFLRQFPDRPDERRKLIDLYIKLGLFNTAREHLTMMFNSPGEKYKYDIDLLDRSATCAQATGDTAMAVEHLDRAIETGKAPVSAFERVLILLRENPGFRDPKFTIAKYTEKLNLEEPYKSNIAARVTLGRFTLLTGATETARGHITRALDEMPGGASDPDALLAGAELALHDAAKGNSDAQAHLNKAIAYLQKAFTLAPKDVRVGILYADALATDKRMDEAVKTLRKAAEALGDVNDQYLRVVDRLLDYGETEQSEKLIDRVATNDADRERIAKYFRGRHAVLTKDWAKARDLLQGVAPVLIRVPEFHKKAVTDLAKCYATFHNPDKQLENALAALKDDATYLPALVLRAEALSKLGKYKEAVPHFRTIVNGYKLEGFRATLVRLEYVNVLMIPAGVRNWAQFEEALGPKEKRTAEINVIHAEALAARGDAAGAAALLREVLKADPKNGAALMALTRGVGERRPEAVLASLEKVKAEFGDSLDLRLAIASVLPYRTQRPTPAEFRALEKTDGLSKTDLHRQWFALGEATMRAAAINEDLKAGAEMRSLAIEFFQKAANTMPLDLVSRATLIDLGLSAGDDALVKKSLDEIAAIEGKDGPIGTIGRIAARLPEVAKMQDKEARAAEIKGLRDSATKVREIRSNWARIYIALAQLDKIEGLHDAELQHYREALDKGDRQEFVIRRVVELYREQKKDEHATAVLNSLSAEINLPDDLERFRTIKNLMARDIPKDQKPTIERIAPLESNDYRTVLLRGALMAAIREDADAETAFRKAVAIGDHVPDTWAALVTHLVRQGKVEVAKGAIKEAETKLPGKATTPVAKGEVLLALAGCYEVVGDIKTASERYQQAVAAAPQELSLNREWIRFLQRHGQGKQANDLLKKLTESPAQDLARWGRRTLAMSMLVGRDAYHNRVAALNLIEQNLAVGPTDTEDVKAKAVVQTIDPVTRDEGITKLREFAQRYDLTPEEFYLLARLYFDQGKISESVDYFVHAARPRPGVTLQHLSGLIRCHLAMNRVDQAQAVLDRLKTAAPASWEAAREEARVLARQGTENEKRGDKESAKKYRDQALEKLLNFPGPRTERFVQFEFGPALEELGFLKEAEFAYAKLMEKSESAAPHLPLGVFLIMQRRTDEAIKLARANDTAKVPVTVTAQLLTGAVRSKNPGGADERFVEEWLAAKLKEYAGKREYPVLVAARAELLDAQEKYDAAIAEYKKALESRSPDLSDGVVNNLATLIALHKPTEVETAIKLMTDLIGIRGPAPAFLDTRAVAYVVSGGIERAELAVRDLELAIAQQRKPLYVFHLAWASELVPEKRSQSSRLLEESKQLGMSVELLHPLELKKFGTRYGLRSSR